MKDQVLSERAGNYRVLVRSQGWKQLVADINEEVLSLLKEFRRTNPVDYGKIAAIQEAINAYEKIIDKPHAIIRLDDEANRTAKKENELDE